MGFKISCLHLLFHKQKPVAFVCNIKHQYEKVINVSNGLKRNRDIYLLP